MTISELKQEVLMRLETADEQMLLRVYSILSADDREITDWWDELDRDMVNATGKDGNSSHR